MKKEEEEVEEKSSPLTPFVIVQFNNKELKLTT
jgi:hypothetical protein